MSRQQRKKAFRKCLFEQLESRNLLAAVAWTGAGGDLLWSNPANWSNNEIPGVQDDVTIDAPGSATIHFNLSGSATLKSLNVADSLRITSGSIVVNGTLSVSPGQSVTVEGSGVSFSASGRAEVDGVSLIVDGMSSIALPIFTQTTLPQSTTWRASNGGVLDLSGIASIDLGTNFGSALVIDAQSGGLIDLRNVTQITDREERSARRANISADGTNSQIDLRNLTRFEQNSFGFGGWHSTLAVTSGAEVIAPLLTNLKTVDVTLNGPIGLATRQWSNWVNGTGNFSGGSYDLPNLSDISTLSFFVGNGGIVSIPSIREFSNSKQIVLWQTSNGGVLDLSGITAINLGASFGSALIVDAQSGGRIDLRNVISIRDRAESSARLANISVNGINSLIDLRNLITFQQNSIWPGWHSTLSVTNGGTVSLGSDIEIRNIRANVDGDGRLLAGVLTLQSQSQLRASGQLYASLNNVAGQVIVAGSVPTLHIHGDYVQSANASLLANINGSIESGNYSRLIVDGDITLAGELQILRDSGFVPDLFSDYPIISGKYLSGSFDSVVGTELDGEDLTVQYGTSAVAISRIFNRDPIATFHYENPRANQRSFLDVRQVSGGTASFRIFDPQGRFVSLSNAPSNDPNFGDLGTFVLGAAGTYEVRVYAAIGLTPSFDAAINYAPLVTQPAGYRETISDEIRSPGTTHVWEYDVKSGDEINLEVLNIVGTSQKLSFVLRAPDGRTLIQQIGDESSIRDTNFPVYVATVNGRYSLTVDGVGDDVAAYQFVLTGSRAPFVRSHAVRGPEGQSTFNEAWFQFDQPMHTASFSLTEDILRFRGPTGDLQIADFRWESPTTLVVIFPGQPAEHELQMVLAPSIINTLGIPLDQNNNRLPGEAIADQYTATLRLDRQGPFVIHTEPGSIGSVPLDRATFYFSEPIDANTFTLNDVINFTGPGGVDLREQLNKFLVRDRSVTVYFEAQTNPGIYSITLGPNIADLAGNAMDQSRNGVAGEASDHFIHQFELRASNLRVISVADPQSGTHPTELTFTWQVRNTGTDPATGTWWDYVYLSRDQQWDLDDVIAARVLYDTTTRGTLQPGESYTQTITVRMPGMVPGEYRVILRSNALRSLVEAAYLDNLNTSLSGAYLDLPELKNGIPSSRIVQNREELLYRVQFRTEDLGKTLLIRFGTTIESIANELLISKNQLPTSSNHLYRSRQHLQSNQWLLLSNLTPGTYFIRAAVNPFSQDLSTAGLATIGIEFMDADDFSVIDAFFGRGGNIGDRTVEINGINLTRNMKVSLTKNGQMVSSSINVVSQSTEKMFATFDLRNLAPGIYDVTIQRGNQSSTVTNSFEVVEAIFLPEIIPTIVTVPAFRRSWFEPNVNFPLTISWSNLSFNDAIAPVIRFSSTEPFAVPDNGESDEDRYVLEFVASAHADGPRGILLPGQSGTITLQIMPRLATQENVRTPAVYSLKQPIPENTDSFPWDRYLPFILGELPENLEPSSVVDYVKSNVGITNHEVRKSLSSYLNHDTTYHTKRILRSPLTDLISTVTRRGTVEVLGGVVGHIDASDPSIALQNLSILIKNVDSSGFLTTITDRFGKFHIPSLPPGQYQVRVAGFRIDSPDQPLFTVDAAQQRIDFITTIQRTLLRGRLIPSELAELSVQGLTVWAFQDDDLIDSTLSDSNGIFELNGLDDRSVRIVIRGPGIAESSHISDVLSGTLEIPVVQESRIVGKVALSNEPESPDSLFALVMSEEVGSDFRQVAIFNDRHFVFNGLPSGKYTIYVVDGVRVFSRYRVNVDMASTLDIGEVVPKIPAGPEGEDGGSLCAGNSNCQEAPWYMIPILNETELFLWKYLIPSERAFFGFDNASLYMTFMSTSPASPSPVLSFNAGSQLVEGGGIGLAPGFRYDSKLVKETRKIVNDGLALIKSLVQANPCECVATPKVVYLEEFTETVRYIDFSGALTVAGNVAGGVGEGDVFKDVRIATGEFHYVADCDGNVEVTPHIYWFIFDTIDFIPGSLGGYTEHVFTWPLKQLEKYGWAYDVPFSVRFRDRLESISPESLVLKVDVTECEECCPEPPDPCVDPEGFALWAAECGKAGGSGSCGSYDPNDILGPPGFGDKNWIQSDQRFDYTVRFENDPEEATAPAALVRITQTLDPSFDFDTFRFGSYGFGNYVFTDATGLPSYESRVNLRSTIGIYVDVKASFDKGTGEILFVLESVDPATGLIPFNPFLGFLPPNREGSEGEGFFTYSISPKSNLPTGTRIDAEAKIYFDANEPIDTPPIFHTIDVNRPSSTVGTLNGTTRQTNFSVTWSGSDEQYGVTGSGIGYFDVFVSINDGPFTQWLTRTSETSSIYEGLSGNTYAFYSIATDNVGYREQKTPVAEASTRVVVGSPWQNPRNPLDADNDQSVSPLDVLVLINFLNARDGVEMPPQNQSPYLDVDGDLLISPLDVLFVINYLNQQGNGEGEASTALQQSSDSNWQFPIVSLFRDSYQHPVDSDRKFWTESEQLPLNYMDFEDDLQYPVLDESTDWALRSWSPLDSETRRKTRLDMLTDPNFELTLDLIAEDLRPSLL